MVQDKKVTAVLLAAGSAARFGAGYNKVLAMLGEKPVYLWSLEILTAHPAIDQVILVAQEKEFDAFDAWKPGPRDRFVAGGATRRESVLNALNAADADIVLIQDGARPFLKSEYIDGCLAAMEHCAGATVAAPSTDTIKISDEYGLVKHTTNRADTWLTQTPQCFDRLTLLQANDVYDGSYEATDDCMLLEHLGMRVAIVPGSRENIKITTQMDLLIAKALLESR